MGTHNQWFVLFQTANHRQLFGPMGKRGTAVTGNVRHVVFGMSREGGKFQELRNGKRKDLETKRTKEIQKTFLFCS